MQVTLLQLVAPGGEEVVPHGLVEVAGVRHERRRQQDIADNGGHLVLERLAACLPALLLTAQTAQQANTPLDLIRNHWETLLVNEYLQMTYYSMFKKIFI